MIGAAAKADDVFLNCPFDDEFLPIFRSLLFTTLACGFRPRSALEVDDGSQTRIEKIVGIIAECRYGIHDLSRTELDAANGLPRFNMPLELGLFLGAKWFGNKHQGAKRALILDVGRYRHQRFISDLAGMDIHQHRGEPLVALEAARDWLCNSSRRRLPSARRIGSLYQSFLVDLPAMAERLEFDPDRIPYLDFEYIAADWLLNDPPFEDG